MRTKSFILTFLMMMFCSIGFGQSGTGNHWNPDEHQYANNMDVIAIIEIDDVEQKTESLEVGAFCGTELRASSRPMKAPMLENRYIVFLDILGDDDDDLITFKLYDHSQGIELNYVIEKPINFRFGQDPLGSVDAPYVLEFLTPVAKIGDVHYRTLPLAVEAATAGQTVELVADATGAGVVIDKNITVDFGGNTYTINQAVGSTGTESQGFQLLKDNTVTLKNGNIAIAENTNVKWMFNAYANVTLAGLNVNCANMKAPAENESNYVLVVNNGGGATPKVTYNGVNYSNFPGSNAPLYVDPSTELVAEAGLNVETDKGYVVEYADNAYTAVAAVAKIGDVYYRTLPLAVEAATAGQTVELIADAIGAGLVINKNITVDFGGNTYTVNQAVGSTGTESQGFQLLKNNTVTLKNGNIAIAENTNVKWMFNAYANVTLAGLNVNCANMKAPAENESNYVLVVNNGGGATPTVNYNSVNVTNFPSTNQIWLDPTTTFKAVAGLENSIKTEAGYVVVYNNGEYTAVPAVAKIGDVYYRTLPLAVEAATAGQTVELIAEATGAGLKINKDITVDFGSYTYTINQAVGSTGTESQGFQLLPEAEDVKLMNGNIAVTQGTNVVWMINDYAKNLTVKNMTFDCENMVWSKSVYFLVGNNEHGTDPKCVFEGVAINNYRSQDRAMVLLENNTELKAQAGLDVVTDPGFAVVYENGVYKVAPAVASITANEVTRYYATLQAAYDAAEAGKTITLLKDVTGAGLKINKNITIDFGGFTYSFNEGVGSGSLTSNGFQLLGGNVVLKNGTLKVADADASEFYILVQNYTDLTVENMTLDGTNLDKWSTTDGDSYVLSNNSGEVKIIGATNITANDEGNKAFAFDVCKYGSYTAPEVNVNTTGIIDGKIEVSESISNNLNISGGLFTTPIEEAWCADGYIPTTKVVDGTTYYTVKEGEYVAQIGDKKYEKFADAIAAVNNGETITLLTDNAESVTIIQLAGKSFTIDGAGKTYKGTINVNGNGRSTGAETLTIKNVNFLAEGYGQSSISAVKKTYVHNLTVDGCTFTGNNKEQYGIYLRHSYNIVVKNIIGEDLYDLVYANTAVTGFTAENVTVTESGMGFMMPYGINLSFKNVTLDVESAGVGIYNYNASKATFEDCNFTAYPPVRLDQKNATNAYSLTFNGTNTFAGSDEWLEVIGTDAKFTVTLNDPSLDVHKTSGLIAGVGNVYYNTFDYALAQAKSTQEGDAVEILKTVILSADKAINFENIAVTSTVNPAFRITGGATVTVENGNMNTEDGGYNFILGASDGSTGNLTIKSGKYHASTTVASVTKGNLVIEGGEFSATPYNGDCRFLINCIDANYNADPRTANVEIKGGTFVGFDPENNAAEGAGTNFCAEGYLSDDNGNGTYTVREGVYVAQVNDGAKYESLVEAVAAAEDNDVVKLLDDATGAGLVINKDITVDFGGFTYTINQAVGSTGTETQGFQLLPSAENVTLKNGTINVDGANVIWMINDYAKNLTVEEMTFNCSGMNLGHSAVMGLVINNLNNTDPKVVFGENVIFDGLTTSILLEHDTQLTAGEGWMNAIEPEDGYVVVYKEGVYTVARPVASITREGVTTEYATLGDATAAAVNGDVVNLLCDVNGSEVTVDLQVAKKITVDLGGHKYTSTGTAFIAFRSGTELTITNGTVNGNGAGGGTLRATYKATLILGAGLTVNAGPQATAIVIEDGKFFVNPNTENVIVNGGIDCIKVQEDALEVSIASGTYTEDVQEWCAQGYVSQNNGDGTWTVREADYVAEIEGGAKYESLQAAIDAAQDGDVIVLLQDIELSEADLVTVNGASHKVLVKVDGKDITLNMQNYKITVNHQNEYTDNGNLIVAVICVEDGAGLTVTGEGTIDVTTHSVKPNIAYMFWKRGTTGHLTIENGTFHMNDTFDSMVYTNGDEIVTVKGGTFTLDAVGTDENGSPWIFNVKGQDAAHVIVNGGTFNADINHQYWAEEVYVPNTLALENNSNGTWTVVNAVAQGTDSYRNYGRELGYASIADAVNWVNAESTINLVANVELDAYVTIDKSVDLNLGQFNITRENGTALYFNGAGIEVTINGAGTVSADHAVYVDNGTVTIDGGNYVGHHAVYVINNGHAVINGGTFKLKEGADPNFLLNEYDATRDVTTIAVKGGKFHQFNPENNAAEGAGTNFCAEGYMAEKIECEHGDCYEVIEGVYVAQVGEVKYKTVAAAVVAATAGETVTLIANVTEDVTISKNLTIDGAGKNYTGNISVDNSVNKNVVATVKNVNFVNGTYYAITTNRIKSITVENCTVTNYGYGFLFANKSTPTVVVKNVTVDGGNYGFHWVYGTTATLENVTMTNVTYGLYIQNYAGKTINVKNSTISSIAIWERSGYSGVQTFKFEGVNTVGTLTGSQYAKYVLAATDATLTAPEGSTVTTTVDGYKVAYENGQYCLKPCDYVAEIEGGAKYESLQAAIDAAQDGQTVIVLKDITLGYEDANDYFDPEEQYKSFFNISGKAVTVNLNEKTVKAVLEGEETVMAFFSTENGGDLTIKGGNLEINTEKAVYSLLVCYTGGKLTVENGNYKLNLAADDLVYTQEDNNVVINGGTFHLGNVGTGQNGQPWIINAKGQNSANVDVNGGTFNFDINHQFWANEVYVPETKALQNNGDGTWKVVESVAYVEEIATSTYAYSRKVGYATLAEAVNPLGNSVDNTVTVIKSHELAETVIVNKNVNIDFAEKDVEGSLTPAIRIQGGANVTIKNGKMNTTGYNFILGASDGSSAGNLTIESGEYHAQTSVVSVTKGHLNITGGDFSVEPYQGNYAYLINCIDANYNNETATVAISGGTFHNWNPQNNAAEGAGTNFCASGYGAVEKSTGVWEVVPMQGMKISAGWNWFSSYIDINGEAGLVKLQDALNPYGVQIKGNGGFTQYTEGQGWFGTTLTSVSVKEMYMINMTEDHELQLKGKLVDPDQNAITLEHGWNWIGYQLNQELDLNDALSKLSANNGDYIKTHNGIAQYIQGYGWWGTLTTMKPGVGYMYDNISADDNTLVYSYPEEGAKTELRTNVTSDNNRWVPVSYKYAHNMNIIAVVEGMESENYEVAAFVGGEVRGSARPIYVEPLDANIVFLTIYGDDVEEMTFKCYDLATGEEYDLNNRMNYSDDAVVGSIDNPYLLSRGTTGIGESALTEVNIYPNPTTTGREVNLGSVCDTVEVFNALGVKIAEYTNVDTIDALETAGIYVIRITNDGNVQNCRLIVK